ncbi:hypothetical protein NR800_31295 [Corallococcus interemptor]|uniref:PD-(D/E)XK nuclease domain-containing protein n=1 Tax=Corallococcus interemptor TaxID=2316720 RepID=UPI0035D4DF58
MASTPISAAELSAFKATLKSALVDAFGEASDWVERTMSAGQFFNIIYMEEYELAEQRREEVHTKNLLLAEAVQYLDRLAARSLRSSVPVEAPALEKLEVILQRFHRVALRLRQRHDDRPTLNITDEYDVQDLLHALLLVSFSDVRDEETGPSHAGGRPRFDFLLKEEQIVIEVKKTRQNLSIRDLNDELIADIARYQAHPDCKTLVCFVYDPDHRIPNVAGFIRDLERTASIMPVRVVVVPVG